MQSWKPSLRSRPLIEAEGALQRQHLALVADRLRHVGAGDPAHAAVVGADDRIGLAAVRPDVDRDHRHLLLRGEVERRNDRLAVVRDDDQPLRAGADQVADVGDLLARILVGVGRRQSGSAPRPWRPPRSGPAGSPRTATSETARNTRSSRLPRCPGRAATATSSVAAATEAKCEFPAIGFLRRCPAEPRCGNPDFPCSFLPEPIFSLRRGVRLISGGLRPASPPREFSSLRSRRVPSQVPSCTMCKSI